MHTPRPPFHTCALLFCWLQLFLLPAIGLAADQPVRSEPPAKAIVLRGTVTNYSLSLPPGNWQVHRSAQDYDLTFSLDNRLNFGVSIGPVPAGDSKSFAESSLRFLKTNYSTLQLSSEQSITVDGREWQRFHLAGRVEQDEVLLILQVYSGPEGTVSIVGSSYADEAMQNRRDIIRVLSSFTFPPPAPGDSLKVQPTPAQTNAPPAEKAP